MLSVEAVVTQVSPALLAVLAAAAATGVVAVQAQAVRAALVAAEPIVRVVVVVEPGVLAATVLRTLATVAQVCRLLSTAQRHLEPVVAVVVRPQIQQEVLALAVLAAVAMAAKPFLLMPLLEQ